jgi:hypothetical protein
MPHKGPTLLEKWPAAGCGRRAEVGIGSNGLGDGVPAAIAGSVLPRAGGRAWGQVEASKKASSAESVGG